jgi:GNAT superfamily N-acetyltransferase
MELQVTKAGLKEISALRMLFLHEGNFQFTYDKCHLHGWADTYLFIADGNKAGYGSVWGKDRREDRDSIFEFYILEPYRKLSGDFFLKFHAASGASHIECQSNDMLLTSLLYEHSQNISAEAILFEDYFQTQFVMPSVVFEKIPRDESTGKYDHPCVLKHHDEILASGGLMLNYNLPYADLYYDVNEQHRRKGLGVFMVQELKKEAYRIGRVPAARCNIRNNASRLTLLKAGFRVCGWRIQGRLQPHSPRSDS